MFEKIIKKTLIATISLTALGVAFLPNFSNALEDTSNTPVTVTLSETLTLTLSSDTLELSVTPSGPVATAALTATVNSNNAAGFNLKMRTTHSGGPALVNTTTSSLTIPAGAPAVNSSAWGVMGGDLASYTALTTADQTVYNQSTIGGTVATNFTFGASASSTQAAGNYEGTVAITATANS